MHRAKIAATNANLLSRFELETTALMRSRIKPRLPSLRRTNCLQTRDLMTLAIETSCDDTSVAILESCETKASLHFHSKVTSDNREHQGVHPIVSLLSHQSNLAKLIKRSLSSLPVQRAATAPLHNALLVTDDHGTQIRKKPDFITVTRGPGMKSNLGTGLDTAKGLAVAWQVPLLGVNHMQAHALTPRLVSALEGKSNEPKFPFLSLLVSGGHTMLVHSKSLCDHGILANTSDIAIGDLIDKCARELLPADLLRSSGDVMYGRVLEAFAFPDGIEGHNYIAHKTRAEEVETKMTEYGWGLSPPLAETKGGQKAFSMEYSFTGLGSAVKRLMVSKPDMPEIERRQLAEEVMRVTFEHLGSRLLLALQLPDLQEIDTIVVSGGVAANRYLKTILRKMLDQKGRQEMRLLFPPGELCTDNAAMIAWAGMEMWNTGWRSDMACLPLRKWSIDTSAECGGILDVDGWLKTET